MNLKLIIALPFFLLAAQSVFAEQPGRGAFNKFINNDTNGSSFQESVLLPDICDYSKCKTQDCLTEVFNKTVLSQELQYVSDNYGKRGKDWNVSGFDRVDSYVFDNVKYYDDLGIEIMATGENKVLHFDITSSVNTFKDKQFYTEEKGAGMKILSPEFENNGPIPSKFTCQGDDINPPLVIENIPKEAKSLVLIVDDPDAPMVTWVHWVVFDIPLINRIEENSIPGKQGRNDFSRKGYGGPCPPSGTHRYFFKIYALDKILNLSEGIASKELEKAMEGHILEQAELIGLYNKTR